MRTQVPEKCVCIGVFEVTVNFVQQRLLGDALQLFCVDWCLQSPLKTNSAFRINRFLVLFSFFLWRSSPHCGSRPPHSRGFQITHNDAPQAVGLIWTRDQLVAETSTWQHTTRQTSMALVAFEHTVWADERPQTYALNRAATGTGCISC